MLGAVPNTFAPDCSLLYRGSFSGETAGKNREKTGKLKNRGRAGDDGKGHFFSIPSVPRALPFPFSPAPARFISPLPILQPTRKTKETSAEQRAQIIVVHLSCGLEMQAYLSVTYSLCAKVAHKLRLKIHDI